MQLAYCNSQWLIVSTCKTNVTLSEDVYRAGEMAQWLRTLAILSEDLSSIPSTHIRWFPTPRSSSSDLWGYLHSHRHTIKSKSLKKGRRHLCSVSYPISCAHTKTTLQVFIYIHRLQPGFHFGLYDCFHGLISHPSVIFPMCGFFFLNALI